MPDEPESLEARIIARRKSEPKRKPDVPEARLEEWERQVHDPEERAVLLGDLSAARRERDVKLGEERHVDPVEEFGAEVPSPVVGGPEEGLYSDVAAIAQGYRRARAQRKTGVDPREELSSFVADQLYKQNLLDPAQAVLPEELQDYIGISGQTQEGRKQTDVRALAAEAATPFTLGLGMLDAPGLRHAFAKAATEGRGEEEKEAMLAKINEELPSLSAQAQQALSEKLDVMFPEALQSKVTAGGAGITVESPAMAALRFWGGITEKGVIEPALAMRTPAVSFDDKAGLAAGGSAVAELLDRIGAGEDAGDVVGDVWGRLGVGTFRMEQALLNTTPAQRGSLSDVSLRHRGRWSKPVLRALYGTEQGLGLPDDLEASAKVNFPESENLHRAAWWTGMAGSVLAPWEAPFIKPLTGGVRLAKVATKIPKAMSKADSAKVLAAMARGDSSPMRAWAGDIGDAISAMDTTPEEVWHSLDHTHQRIMREMAEDQGVDIEELLGAYKPRIDMPPPGGAPPPPPATTAPKVKETPRYEDEFIGPAPKGFPRREVFSGATPLPDPAAAEELEKKLRRLMANDGRARVIEDQTRRLRRLLEQAVKGEITLPEGKLDALKGKLGEMDRELAKLEPDRARLRAIQDEKSRIAEVERLGGTEGDVLTEEQALGKRLPPDRQTPWDPVKRKPAAQRRLYQAQEELADATDDLNRRLPEEALKKAEGAIEAKAGPAREAIQQADMDLAGLGRFNARTMKHYRDVVYPMHEAMKGWSKKRAGDFLRSVGLQDATVGRHAGGETMRWLYPGQTPETPQYRLVDPNNKELFKGTLEEALERISRRKRMGDRVQFEDRDVAMWRKGGKTRITGEVVKPGELAPHYLFSLPEEAAVLDEFVTTRGGVVISMDELVRQGHIVQENMGLGTDRRALDRLWKAIAGVPLDRVKKIPLDDRDRLFVELLQDSADARVGRTTRETVPFVGNLHVTKAEGRAITKRMKAQQSDTGYRPEDVAFTSDSADGVADFKPGQKEAMDRFYGRSGLAVPDEPTRADLRGLNAEVATSFASRAMDQKWAHLGMGSISAEIMSGIARLSEQTTPMVKGALRNALFSSMDVTKLSKGPRKAFENAVSDLLGEQNRLRIDVRNMMFPRKGADGVKLEGMSREDALTAALEGYRPIPKQEMDLYDKIDSFGPMETHYTLAARKQIDGMTKDLTDYPGLRSNNERAIRSDMKRFMDDKRAEMKRLGRLVIESYIPVDDRAVLWSRLSDDDLIAAWREYAEVGMDSGVIRGSAQTVTEGTAKNLRGKVVPRQLHDAKDAQVQMVVRLRSQEKRKRVIAKLVEQDMAIADPRTVAAVEYLDRPSLDLKHDFTEAELARAGNMRARWGFTDGEAVKLTDMDGVQMPRALVEELGGAAKRGIRITAEGLDSGAGRHLHRAYKDGLTTFIPAYHFTNGFGMPFMHAFTRGIPQMGKDYATIAKNAPMVLELTKRLTASTAAKVVGERVVPLFRKLGEDSNTFVTDLGDIWTTDELARAIEDFGAADVYQNQINARAVAEDIDRYSGEWKVVLPEIMGGTYRATGDPAKYRAAAGEVRDAFVNMSEVPERSVRIGVFLDELKRGRSVEQAAEAARESFFDYTKLTHFDRKLTRNAITFWSFRRKNLDAYMRNMFDHPERIGQQLRFAQRNRDMWGEKDDELVKSQFTEADLGSMKLWQAEPGAKRIDLATGGVNNGLEGLLLLSKLQGLVTGAFGESSRELAGSLSPVLQIPVEHALGVDPGSGYRVDPQKGNLIPPAMMDGATGAFMRLAFQPQKVKLDERHRHMASEMRGGTYFGYAPAPDRNQAWRDLNSLAGRAIDTYMQTVWEVVQPEKYGDPDTTRLMDALQLIGVRQKAMRDAAEQQRVLMTREAGPIKAEIRETKRLPL